MRNKKKTGLLPLHRSEYTTSAHRIAAPYKSPPQPMENLNYNMYCTVYTLHMHNFRHGIFARIRMCFFCNSWNRTSSARERARARKQPAANKMKKKNSRRGSIVGVLCVDTRRYNNDSGCKTRRTEFIEQLVCFLILWYLFRRTKNTQTHTRAGIHKQPNMDIQADITSLQYHKRRYVSFGCRVACVGLFCLCGRMAVWALLLGPLLVY